MLACGYVVSFAAVFWDVGGALRDIPKKRLRLRRLWHLARRYVKFLCLVNWSFMHVIISKHAIEHTCIGREIFFLQQLIALQLDIFNRFSCIYTGKLNRFNIFILHVHGHIHALRYESRSMNYRCKLPVGETSLYFTYMATSMHYVMKAEAWITGASFRYSFRCCELQIAENARNKAFQLPFSC